MRQLDLFNPAQQAATAGAGPCPMCGKATSHLLCSRECAAAFRDGRERCDGCGVLSAEVEECFETGKTVCRDCCRECYAERGECRFWPIEE